MDIEEIKQQIEKHLEAAYGLLPLTLEAGHLHTKRKHLEQKYKNKEWRQVFYFLQDYRENKHFSAELLQHLKAVDELFNLYDRLGMRAALEQLTQEEKRIIRECLGAAAFGPFFPDWEFRLLFAVERDEAIRVAEAWPDVAETDISAGIVINNSINNLFGYPHRKQSEWSNYISVSPKQVYKTYSKFRILTGRTDNRQAEKSEYFHNIAE